jgi:hypothetical protein
MENVFSTIGQIMLLDTYYQVILAKTSDKHSKLPSYPSKAGAKFFRSSVKPDAVTNFVDVAPFWLRRGMLSMLAVSVLQQAPK